MARIFIAYRRDDTSGYAGRLRDALTARFGPDEIFRDTERIAPGDDFVQVLRAAIGSCRVFLAVIGNQWLDITGADGRRRLDDPDDHVRRELAEALARDIRVIPVLVESAEMPRAEDLPAELQPFVYRNAIELDDSSWAHDLERLVAVIRAELGQSVTAVPRTGPGHVDGGSPPARRRGRRVRLAAGAVFVAALATIAVIIAMRSGAGSTTGSTTGTRAVGRVVALPAGSEVQLGEAVLEVLDGRVVADTAGATLRLRVRYTNEGRYDNNFWDALFRLSVDDVVRAPTSGLNEIVAAGTAEDADITFPIPAGAREATLIVENASDRGEIPLDLGRRPGRPIGPDRLTTAAASFDPRRATIQLGGVEFHVLSATTRRYVNKVTLTFSVRMATDADALLGTHNFRLLVGGVPRAPATSDSFVVERGVAREFDARFDLPLDARAVVLRIVHREETAELPVRW